MKFHFVSGLPRSGSTMLMNLLAQNPRFHVTSTSGVLDVISGIRAQWDNIVEFKAAPDDAAKMRVMAGVLPSFYANIDEPVVFDKCRGWVAWFEWLTEVFEAPKVLVPVRDIRNILASLEKLHRRNFLRWHKLDDLRYMQCQTAEGRCDHWLHYDQPLGIAYGRIRDALRRGFGPMMHFVHLERLVADPAREMEQIYSFLGEPAFDHDFDHIEQVTREDDRIYGLGELHSIRPKLGPLVDDWRTVLGDFADVYGRFNLARNESANI